jgi:hypothetical protein
MSPLARAGAASAAAAGHDRHRRGGQRLGDADLQAVVLDLDLREIGLGQDVRQLAHETRVDLIGRGLGSASHGITFVSSS